MDSKIRVRVRGRGTHPLCYPEKRTHSPTSLAPVSLLDFFSVFSLPLLLYILKSSEETDSYSTFRAEPTNTQLQPPLLIVPSKRRKELKEESSSSPFLTTSDDETATMPDDDPVTKIVQHTLKQTTEQAQREPAPPPDEPTEPSPLPKEPTEPTPPQSEQKDPTAITRIPTTRCEKVLASITDEEFAEFLAFTPQRPESMIRKDRWVLGLYSAFCNRGKITTLFPLSALLICGFLNFLAIKCGYALNGIEQVVVPSLRHLHLDRCGSEDKAVVQAMKRTIKSLRTNKRVVLHGRGKQPLCSFDVAELISRIPDTLESKLKDASLFLFALHTGARALTCEAITWGDIVRVDATDTTTGVWRVIVILRVTKGNPTWDHPVCIEGFPELEHPLDVVFYLNQFTIRTVNLNLIQVTKREEGANSFDKKQIWNLSREAMRGRLKKRLEQCGFPPALWSFHSFRSGHICSALLAAGADPGKRANVLEVTAFVAGWVPRGKAQCGYVKTVAEKQIVCSRLLGLGLGMYVGQDTKLQQGTNAQTKEHSTEPSVSPMIYSGSSKVAAEGYIHSPTNTEEFHGIRLKPPNFSTRMYVRTLRARFLSYFPKEGVQKDIKNHYNNCFNRLMIQWGKEELPTGDWQILRKAGCSILKRRLLDGAHPLDLADEMIGELSQLGLNPQDVPHNRGKPHKKTGKGDVTRSTLIGRTGKTSRHRVRWTAEEDSLIRETRKSGKLFTEIREQLASWNRTTEDACQRWRVLVRKEPALAAYSNPRLKTKHA